MDDLSFDKSLTMKKYKIGDKSKAICDNDGLVSTTLAVRDINFKQVIVTTEVFICDMCGEVVSTPAQSTESIKFAFQEERERIDLAKVTLPMSEGPSWHGTIEEINEAMEHDDNEFSGSLSLPKGCVHFIDPSATAPTFHIEGFTGSDEYACWVEVRKKYAPKNDEYTISFDEHVKQEEDVDSIPPSCDTLIAMQKTLSDNKKEPMFDPEFYLRMKKKMEDGTYMPIPDGLTREERRRYFMDKAIEIMNKKES